MLDKIYRATRLNDNESLQLIAVRGGYGIRIVFRYSNGRLEERQPMYEAPMLGQVEHMFRMIRDNIKRGASLWK